MQFDDFAKAQQVADELNQRYGHPRATVQPLNVRGESKWTVIASYAYGMSRLTSR